MTAAAVVVAPRRSFVVVALARQESGRLLRHPVTLVGFALFALECVLASLSDGGPREAFEAVVTLPSFVPGVLMILSANLVATRDHRAGSAELLDSVPVPAPARTAGLLLASLLPTLITFAAILAVDLVLTLRGSFVDHPDAWQLAQGPVTVLGACLLGILVGRWFPAPSVVLLVMVAMVAVNFWLAGGRFALAGPMLSWVEWGTDPREWVGQVEGSSAAHTAYLLGLCGLAAIGAVLRDLRTRLLLVAAVGAVALTVAAGVVQFP